MPSTEMICIWKVNECNFMQMKVQGPAEKPDDF